MGANVERLRQWWAQPDHYRWLSGYLGYRNLRGFTSRMMATVVAALGVVPLLFTLTDAGPDSTVGRVISYAVAGGCAVMATLWLLRWPSRRQSLFFSTTASVCIAAACLVQSPAAGLLGCTAFAALAGYVAFFHTSHQLLLVLSAAGVTTLVCAIRIALTDNVFLAIGALVIIAVGVLAVPFSAQVLVHLLGGDSLKSHTDPLTGLRNRRGFYRSARELIGGTADESQSFVIVMADLDRFKQINDTHGHATGDRILIAVADKLGQATRGHAVVARVGGEEFLVAEATPTGGALDLAERVRQAAASTSWSVTASVGAVSVPLDSLDGDAAQTGIERLVDAADAAMYEAKRAGGNRTRVVSAHGPQASSLLDSQQPPSRLRK